ncbi:MAG: hypothetical protein Q9188_006249 [Gyalolechia gomerana]
MGLFAVKTSFPVDGRTVLLTGASLGMGRSVARLLAQKGANVVIVARNIQRLEEALEHITTSPPQPKPPASSLKPPPGTTILHPT